MSMIFIDHISYMIFTYIIWLLRTAGQPQSERKPPAGLTCASEQYFAISCLRDKTARRPKEIHEPGFVIYICI